MEAINFSNLVLNLERLIGNSQPDVNNLGDEKSLENKYLEEPFIKEFFRDLVILYFQGLYQSVNLFIFI